MRPVVQVLASEEEICDAKDMSGVSYQFQDWLVEPDLNQLQNGKIVKPLEPLAMSVLAFLLERNGEVVTTDSLLDELWHGRNAEPGMVARCIAQIRQALDDDAKNPVYIETIRKRGYRTIASVERLAAQPKNPTEYETPPDSLRVNKTERAARGSAFSLTILGFVLAAISAAWWMTHPTQNIPITQGALEERPADPVNSDQSIKTIAVLPFADMSPDGNQGYFGDGIAEELLNELARLEGLRVASRTSSFSFKGTSAPHDAIADALHVGAILEGSIRKDGNRVRITTQLINAADGFHLWSQTYDRELADVFAIQEDIATSVSGALGVKLGVGGVNAFQGAGTHNIEAYEAYLQGLGLGAEYNNLDNAIPLFQRAIQLDPNYAAAWSQLGRHTLDMWFAYPEEMPEMTDRAYTYMQRALELDPESAQSNSFMGTVLYIKKYRIRSEAAHLKALSLLSDRPNLTQYGGALMRNGRSKAALEQWKRAETIDPLGGQPVALRGFVAIAQGRFTDARDNFSWLPKNRLNYYGLLVALNEGDADVIKEKIAALPPTETYTTALYTPVLGVFDSPEKVLSILRATYADESSRWFSKLHDIALLAAYFGDPELALQALGEEVRYSSIRLQAIWYPVMSEVRRLPGFKSLATELNLVEYWRATEWADLCRPIGENDFECY